MCAFRWILALAFVTCVTPTFAQDEEITADLQTALDREIGRVGFFASLKGTPSGWLPCNGASYLRSEYPGLFLIIGTRYGTGDPADRTFKVPDLAGRTVIGSGSESEATKGAVGDVVGSETYNGPFATDATSGESFYSTRRPNLENPDPFNHTPTHGHTGKVSVSTIQPSMVLRCMIKAK